MSDDGNDELFEAVREFVALNYPGSRALEVIIRLDTHKDRVRLPVPVAPDLDN